MPSQICHDCVCGLNQSYKFATKCRESDKKLQLYFQNKIYQEIHLPKNEVDYVPNVIQHLPEENQKNENACSYLNEIANESSNSPIESLTSIRIRNDLRDLISTVENQNDLNTVPLTIISTQNVANENRTEVRTAALDDPQTEENYQIQNFNWLKSEMNDRNETKHSIRIDNEDDMPAINDLITDTTFENDINIFLRDPLEINNISVELGPHLKIESLSDQTSLSSTLARPKYEVNNETKIEENSHDINKLHTLNSTNVIIKQIDNSSYKETCIPRNFFNSFVLLARCDESELINMTLSNSKAIPNAQKNTNIKVGHCTICGTFFKRKEHLRRHMVAHKKKKPFCAVCKKIFRGNYELRRHMSVHAMKKIYSCNICGANFKHKCHFSVHMRKHTRVTEQPNTDNKSYNAKHQDDEHSDDVIHQNNPSNAYDCQNDRSIFKSESLERCDESEIINMDPSISKAIPNAQKNTNIKLVQCTICKKTFKRKDLLKRHMLAHRKKKPVCTVCGKSFRGNYEFSRHTRCDKLKSINMVLPDSKAILDEQKNTNIKQLQCTFCDKTFRRKGYLKLHMVVHYKKKPACTVCGKSFRGNYELSRHTSCKKLKLKKKVLRNGKTISDAQKNTNVKRLQCTHCDKTFRKKGYLKRHMVVHYKQKPFCTICKKKFRGNYEVSRHMIVHTRKKPLSCNICGKKFKKKRHFSNHMLKQSCVIKQINTEEQSNNIEHQDEHLDNVILQNKPSGNCHNNQSNVEDYQDVQTILENESLNTDIKENLQSNINAEVKLSNNILFSQNMDYQHETVNDAYLGERSNTEEYQSEQSENKDSQNISSNNLDWQMYGLRKRTRAQLHVEYKDEIFQSETSNSDQCQSASSNYTDSESESSNYEEYEKTVRSINVKKQTEQSNHHTNSEGEVSINMNHGADSQSNRLNMEASQNELLKNEMKLLNTKYNQPNQSNVGDCEIGNNQTEGSNIKNYQSELLSNIDSKHIHSKEDNCNSKVLNNEISQCERLRIKDCQSEPSNTESVQSNGINMEDNQNKLLNTEDSQRNESNVKDYEIAPCKENGPIEGSNTDNCERELTSNDNCKSELLNANNNKNYACTFCERKYKFRNSLREHIRTHTHPKKRHKCQVCAHPFREAAELKDHVKVHTAKNPFTCSFCEKIFFTPKILKIHMQSHDEEKPFSCTKCDRKFSKNKYAQKHEQIHLDIKKYKCEVCGRLFRESGNMRSHMKKHSGEKSYSCSMCGKSFYRKEDYELHMQAHYQTKEFPCPICNHFFNTKKQVGEHLHVHSGEGFICSICGKKFALRTNLREHLVSHVEERLFACTICDGSFKSQRKVNNHMRLVHAKGEVTCDLCNRTFKHKQALTYHMEIHSDKRPYQCSFCDKSFRKTECLKIHTRTHTNERPYPCTVCDKSFKQSATLTLHMRTHTNERPYPCASCDFKFKVKQHLIEHTKNKHSEKD